MIASTKTYHRTNHTDRLHRLILVALLVMIGGFIAAGCSSTKPYATGPIKTFDPDTTRIPMPERKEQFQFWDRIDNTTFHQMEKVLDLNRVFRFLGRPLGLSSPREADNINKLDDVPESSWFTYRHYYERMSQKELARGPNTVEPDTSGPWIIFQAKLEGAMLGFFFEDQNGERFLAKFDGRNYPGLMSSVEVIGSRIFHAAGYTVPEATIAYFDPDRILIRPGVEVEENGEMRLMTMDDYKTIIDGQKIYPDGRIRVFASKFVDGRPLGPWRFKGTYRDDPNDRVDHEHRRELRGMRVISSWVNDTDRRDANSMFVYNYDGYIDHYVQDFGNILGANGASIHRPIQGQAYLIDPRFMLLNTVSLGTYVPLWEKIDGSYEFPQVGYFRADVFKPGRWVPTHPNPAFENMTLRDAFWGARIVMNFSDEDIRTMVETGLIYDERAVDYLVETLIERRDMIGRYWFKRINPLDRFEAEINEQTLQISFSDLFIDGNLGSPESHRYKYHIETVDGEFLDENILDDSFIEITLPDHLANSSDHHVIKVELYTLRDYEHSGDQKIDVYFEVGNNHTRLVGIDREV